jgi:hypothetical protein
MPLQHHAEPLTLGQYGVDERLADAAGRRPRRGTPDGRPSDTS